MTSMRSRRGKMLKTKVMKINPHKRQTYKGETNLRRRDTANFLFGSGKLSKIREHLEEEKLHRIEEEKESEVKELEEFDEDGERGKEDQGSREKRELSTGFANVDQVVHGKHIRRMDSADIDWAVSHEPGENKIMVDEGSASGRAHAASPLTPLKALDNPLFSDEVSFD